MVHTGNTKTEIEHILILHLELAYGTFNMPIFVVSSTWIELCGVSSMDSLGDPSYFDLWCSYFEF